MKNAMTFDDIYLLKDSAVKLVLKKIDVMDLEYALMEATSEVKDAFFRNMSKRAEQMITEDMQYNTDVSCKDSFESQQKILDTIFGLEKSGFRKNNTVFFIREFLRMIRAKSTASRLFIATRFPHKNCLRRKRNYKNSRDSSIIPEVLRAAILIFRDSKNSEI